MRKVTFKEVIYVVVISLASILSIFFLQKSEVYKLFTERLDKPTTLLSQCLPSHHEDYLESRINSSSQTATEKTNGVEEEVVSWAYKNAKRYVPLIDVEEIVAEAFKYDNALMYISVIKEESKFDRYAWNKSSNSKGLGQIRPVIWQEELIEVGIWSEEIDVYNYKLNIAAMDYILKKYYEETNSWQKALFKYVNGDTNYVLRVLANFAELTLLTSKNTEKEPDAGDTEVP